VRPATRREIPRKPCFSLRETTDFDCHRVEPNHSAGGTCARSSPATSTADYCVNYGVGEDWRIPRSHDPHLLALPNSRATFPSSKAREVIGAIGPAKKRKTHNSGNDTHGFQRCETSTFC
jgi:hypothetical protein